MNSGITECMQADIYPLNQNSNRIYELRQHALIGVSPFNSYFGESNLIKLINWGLMTFEKIVVFIPNHLSIFTLLALGYTEKETAYKVRRQDSYLHNKVIRAFKALGFEEPKAKEMILTFSQISSNENYKKIYRKCLEQFDQCESFRNGCVQTSSWILENNSKIKNQEKLNFDIAVKYFLNELPFFLDTPSILNVPSSLFIYHEIPKYLELLYSSNDFISPEQGFLKVKFSS